MKKSIFALLAIASLSSTATMAADFEGALSVGGAYSNTTGSNAKANEYVINGSRGAAELSLDYRKLDTYFGIYGGAIIGDNSKYYQEDNARDAKFGIKGGITDQIKANFDYKEINHNIVNGARTFLDGVGTNTLYKSTAPNAYATPDQYINKFDYSTKRYISNGGAEMSFGTPFFLKVNVDYYEQQGILPFGMTTSMHENPAPIDYTSTTTYLQTGYRGKDLVVTVDGSISHFGNENYKLNFWNGTAAANQRQIGYESADSDDYKVGRSVAYKLPFWKTTLMAKANYSMLRSDALLYDNGTSGSYLTPTQWNGKIDYTTVNLSATSQPLPKLSTRIFFNFLNKQNDSNDDFNYGSASYTTEKFDYSKRNYGIDATYQLPAKTALSGGYEYLNINRAIRTDAPSTDDHTVFLQAKNNMLDWMTAKVRYQRLWRFSDFQDGQLYALDPQMETNVAALTSEFLQDPVPAGRHRRQDSGQRQTRA